MRVTEENIQLSEKPPGQSKYSSIPHPASDIKSSLSIDCFFFAPIYQQFACMWSGLTSLLEGFPSIPPDSHTLHFTHFIPVTVEVLRSSLSTWLWALTVFGCLCVCVFIDLLICQKSSTAQYSSNLSHHNKPFITFSHTWENTVLKTYYYIHNTTWRHEHLGGGGQGLDWTQADFSRLELVNDFYSQAQIYIWHSSTQPSSLCGSVLA